MEDLLREAKGMIYEGAKAYLEPVMLARDYFFGHDFYLCRAAYKALGVIRGLLKSLRLIVAVLVLAC